MRSFTRDAIEYGDPILIAPFHEMNLVDSPWSGVHPGNSAAKLVFAWRHTHDVVMSQGPHNITWGWAVNQEPNPDTPENDIAAYYPGDAYVDVVGVDGFNFARPWQDFESLFSKMLFRLRHYGKPIYVFSIASAPGSDKPAWITDALSTQMARYNVVAWIWFNANKEKDWRVNSSPESLEAFKSAVSVIR
jgi:beta-mannanase